MRFFLDESVPDSVGIVLKAAGHEVIHHREVLEQGAKDPVVCQTAVNLEAVLVAVDKDMRYLTARYGKQADDRFRSLNLIMCGCGPVMASLRVEHALGLIEHEWREALLKAGRRLRMEIEKHKIITYR